MIRRTLLIGLAALLSGCIIFDQKSEAVTFHQFAAPAGTVAPASTGTQVFVPRAIIPSALRRPNVVLLDDTGWVHIEDGHRWLAPLDRAESLPLLTLYVVSWTCVMPYVNELDA